MNGLLDNAIVVRTTETLGTSSYEIASPTPYMRSVIYDVCDPATKSIDVAGLGAGDEYPDTTPLPKANVFAVVVDMGSRAMRSNDDEAKLVRDALDAETEKAAGIAFWGGDYTTPPAASLKGPAVGSVAAGSDTADSIAKALEAFWKRAVGFSTDETFVHLGAGALLKLVNQIKDDKLEGIGARVVSSPGYPTGLIAVTGPVVVKLGPDEVGDTLDRATNSLVNEANRLVAIEFDPAAAVRVG